MYCGHARLCVCLCVCLSAAACLHYCTDPDVTWRSGRGWDAPSCALLGGFAINARVALLWQQYGNAWQSLALIRQAHRTPYAVPRRCRQRLTPLAGDKIDVPATCAVPFRPYCGVLYANACTRYMPIVKIVATRRQILRLKCTNYISAGALPQTPLGELTALPQTHYWI